MPNIFISYRREDSLGHTGRLFDRLGKHFGKAHVFMDIAGIEPGLDFVEAIDKAVGSCDVFIVVIGKQWLNATDADGRRRLDNPEDFIRLELATALRRNIRVIPVLVQGAAAPSSENLPEDLKKISRFQAHEISDSRWDFDVGKLIEALEKVLKKEVTKDEGTKEEKVQPKTEYPRLEELSTCPVELEPAGKMRRLWRRIKDVGGKKAKKAEPPVLERVERPRPAPPSAAEPPTPEMPIEEEPASPWAAKEPASVFLGASAPRHARPGDEFTARFVAYVKDLEEEVSKLLKELSPRSRTSLQLHIARWKVGTQVKVRLSGRNLNISPAEQEFFWEGSRNLVEFDVEVPADAVDGITVLKFDVLIDEIIVARLRLDLDISSGVTVQERRTTTIEPARTAFASYASEDRDRVLDRVSAVSISAGLDVFLDCLALHPGEKWKPRLAEEIIKRDLFLLFWSEHAKESGWVTWEWRTALDEKGSEAMQIHPLQPDVEPPKELKELHFGDVYMWVRKNSEGSVAKPADN